MRKARENVLATKDNQSFFPGSTPVWIEVNGRSQLNGLMHGQPILYNPHTKVSIAVADADNYSPIVLGVGWNPAKSGAAASIRKVFGDTLYPEYITAMTAEPPRCGLVDVWDMFFKCVKCNYPYKFTINERDDVSENQYPYNRPHQEHFEVNTDCCACDDCVGQVDPHKLVCAFLDRINNRVATDVTKLSKFAKLAKSGKPPRNYYAVRLYGDVDPNIYNSVDYCLNPVTIEGDCENCLQFAAIGSVVYAGVTYPVPADINFQSGEDFYTYTAKLERLTAFINGILGNNGSAVTTSATSGTGRPPCCPYNLQVNACNPSYELDGESVVAVENGFQLLDGSGVEIAPCGTSNPFTPINLPNNCPTCPPGAADQYIPVAGIRIIGKPVDINCSLGDLASGNQRGIIFRSFTVAIGEGFSCGSARAVHTQKMQIPENLGYEWIHRETLTDNGGSGRSQNAWGADPHGDWGMPLGPQDGRGGSRVYSAASICKEMYCSFIIEHGLPSQDTGIHGESHATRGRTAILVPSGDATTRTEMALALNNIRQRFKPFLASVECTTDQSGAFIDQDQIEQIVNPSTGLVTQGEYPNTGVGAEHDGL